jgi:hypothetical protein
MSAWSHLPNVAHIDRVLASVKAHSEVWSDAFTVGAADTVWDAAWYATLDVAWDATLYDAYYAARDVVMGDAARDVDSHAAWNAARGAILALVAYDDCAKYLSIPSDQLRVWTILSENPAATLLIPAVIAFERISELEMV